MPDPSDPQSLNRYSYVLNNPLKYGDPSGHQVSNPPMQTPVDWWNVVKIVESLSVAAGPEAVAITTSAVVTGVAMYYGTRWAMQDMGPDYQVPEYLEGTISSSYSIPAGTTLSIDTVYLATSKGLISLADHLGFAMGFGANGLPNFPGPDNRHDKDKNNDIKNNGKHIRNALKGIQRNLGRQDLRTYLQGNLEPEQYDSFTRYFDYLVTDLKNQEWLFEQFGQELSQEILNLLSDMNYVVP